MLYFPLICGFFSSFLAKLLKKEIDTLKKHFAKLGAFQLKIPAETLR